MSQQEDDDKGWGVGEVDMLLPSLFTLELQLKP